MLQEELECLRQTKQVLALAVSRKKGGNAGTTVVDEATLVCSHVLWLGVRRVTTGGCVAVRLRRRIERRVSGESVVTRFLWEQTERQGLGRVNMLRKRSTSVSLYLCRPTDGSRSVLLSFPFGMNNRRQLWKAPWRDQWNWANMPNCLLLQCN